MKQIVLLIVLAGTTALCTAWAGDNVWTSLGPDGGGARALAIDPLNPNNLYALTSVGLFKSTDGGASWVATPHLSGGVRSFVIDPQNPSTLYAALADWVWKSTDGGESWRALKSGLISCGPLAIDPMDPSIIYTGGSNDIFKSTDGGETWNRSNSGLPALADSWLNVKSLVIEPRNPSTVYAVTRVGVFKSTNRGASWSALYPFSGRWERPEFDALTIDPQDPNRQYAWRGRGAYGGVFKSTDGGASWSAANSGLPIHATLSYPISQVSDLAIHPQNTGTLYAATPWGLYKSTNGAANWTKLDSQPGGGVQIVALDPQNPSIVYVSAGDSDTGDSDTSAGVYKSTDGAATWRAINSGLRAIGIHGLKIPRQQPATLYANAYDGMLLKSTDKGTSWNQLTSVNLLAVDPQDPDTLFGSGPSVLTKSTDGGTNWSPATLGLPNSCYGDYYTFIAIDPQAARTVYLGFIDQLCGSGEFGGGVWKSTDGGANWSKLESLPGGPFIHGLAIDPQSSSTVYASTDMGLFKSTDGGTSWSRIRSGRALQLTIDPQNPDTLYTVVHEVRAGELAGVYKSTDGGENWTAVSSGLPIFSRTDSIHALLIDPRDTGTLYALVRGMGVYKTTDGGASWSAVNYGLSTLDVSNLAIDPQNAGTVYAATAGGVFAITFTK